ncbi:MAG: hypothetical protein KDC87_18160, partial [Planctomycetes bacterium]|nr:hypothetical protein [Planctomycetota bacterium]
MTFVHGGCGRGVGILSRCAASSRPAQQSPSGSRIRGARRRFLRHNRTMAERIHVHLVDGTYE